MSHQCPDITCASCRTAVKRAYEGLLLVGQDDRSAFNSAVLVLSLRRPGRSRDEYEWIVASWLSDEPAKDELKFDA